jgi:hypothetical protein
MGGERGVDTFLGWVKTLVIFPTGLMSVSFGSMAERWSVGVHSRQLTELLPCPVRIVVAVMLDVAIAMCDIETGFCLVPHHHA